MSFHDDDLGRFPNYMFLLDGELLAKSSWVSSALFPGEKVVQVVAQVEIQILDGCLNKGWRCRHN